jgi:hypothetical protein
VETIYRGGSVVRGFTGVGLGYFESGRYHSWAEVSDLVNAYSYMLSRMNDAVGIGCGDVSRRRTPLVPPGEPGFAQKYRELDAWMDDFNNAYAQFMAVRDAAIAAMKNAWNSTFDIAPATSDDPAFAEQGGNVFDALATKWAPFPQLDARLRQIAASGGGFPASCLPTYPHVPQPTATDYSLEAYQGLDAMVRGGKEFFQDISEGVKHFVSSPPILFVGVVVLAVSSAVIVSHVMPKTASKIARS